MTNDWVIFGPDNQTTQDLITGVEDVKSLTPSLSKGEGTVYNLAGQCLSNPQKGINIKDGKKVLVK